MKRNYPPLRLTPQVAGKLQHDFDRISAQFNELKTLHVEFENQIRQALGADSLWSFRKAARNTILARQLASEIRA
ncbi:hypothetical protein [Pseudomonas sp. MGal98]|uniref:hypothetical protein n=1 Tax=Pseudomonas sp. MGal98 TaxID=3162460 RepID=UPI0032ED8512